MIRRWLPLLVLATLVFGLPLTACGQSGGIPAINLSIDSVSTPEQLNTTIQIVILITILSLAPSILIMTTSFTRIVVIFHFLRQAIGTQNAPSNQILIGVMAAVVVIGFSLQTRSIESRAKRPQTEATTAPPEEEPVPQTTFTTGNDLSAQLWKTVVYVALILAAILVGARVIKRYGG
ncbi:unnamed protein product, partial [marine sediment metagenome]